MSRVRISFPAPRYPHYFFILCRQAGRRYSQVVRPRSAKPLSPGSNPGGASKKTLHTPCRVFLSFSIYQTCRCGGIGRRKGLKIPRSNIRAGSSPASGTKNRLPLWGSLFLYISTIWTDLRVGAVLRGGKTLCRQKPSLPTKTYGKGGN